MAYRQLLLWSFLVKPIQSNEDKVTKKQQMAADENQTHALIGIIRIQLQHTNYSAETTIINVC